MGDSTESVGSVQETVNEMSGGDPAMEVFGISSNGATQTEFVSPEADDIVKEIMGMESDESEESKEDEQVTQESIPATEATSSEESSDTTEQATEVQDEAASEEIPLLKASLGEDKTLDVPESAKFTIKIAGEQHEVELKDLTRNYQGKVPWEKHYQETKERERMLVQRERMMDQKEATENAVLNDVVKLIKENPFGAMEKLLLDRGEDPSDALKAYLQQAKATMDEVGELDETSLNAIVRDKSVGYKETLLDQKAEKAKKTEDFNAENQELHKYEGELKEKFNIPDTDFIEAYNKAVELDADSESSFSFKDMSSKEILESCANYVVSYSRPFKHITNIMREVDPSIQDNDEGILFVKDVVYPNRTHLPQYEDKDILDIVRAYLNGTGEQVKTEQSVEEAKTESSKDSSSEGSQKPTSQTIPPKNEEVEAKAEGGTDTIGAGEDDFDAWLDRDYPLTKNW